MLRETKNRFTPTTSLNPNGSHLFRVEQRRGPDRHEAAEAGEERQLEVAGRALLEHGLRTLQHLASQWANQRTTSSGC